MLNRKNKRRAALARSPSAAGRPVARGLHGGAAPARRDQRPGSGSGRGPEDHLHPQAAEQPLHRHGPGRRQEGRHRGGLRQVAGGRPAEASASSQVSFINAETQAGTNAIVIAANDPDAVCPALNEARDAGTKVVTFDSDTNPDCRDMFINQATAEGIAQIQVKMISEQIGGSAARSRSCRPPPTPPTRTRGSST